MDDMDFDMDDGGLFCDSELSEKIGLKKVII